VTNDKGPEYVNGSIENLTRQSASMNSINTTTSSVEQGATAALPASSTSSACSGQTNEKSNCITTTG